MNENILVAQLAESQSPKLLVGGSSPSEYANCVECGTALVMHWTKKQYKFCSRSCSTTFNNRGRQRNASKFPKKIRVKKPGLSAEEKLKRHKAIHNEAWQRYMAKKRNQTPPDADLKAMQEFYYNCPAGHEVDHIIPISLGGLHHLPNLQYLTISENRKKSNKIY